MSSEDVVGSSSHFWNTLFQQEQLARRLNHVAADPDPKLYRVANYGEIQLRAETATKLGDGYMSDAFIMKATTKETSFTAFVKAMPSNPFQRASALDQRLYDREVGIYQHFHPLLRRLRVQKGFSDSDVPLNVARIYYTNLSTAEDEPSVLVMEDLRSEGFAMADKLVGCTLPEAEATVTSLASYHALSIAVTRQWKTSSGHYHLPEELSFVWQKTLFDAKGPEMLAPAIPLHCEIMRRLGHPEAASWLQTQAKDIVNIMSPDDVGKCGPLACLLHADCWNNNIMYRMADGVEMRLVDWQITRMGHPVTDLLHFFFSSASPELRADHFAPLMADYFIKLKENLAKLDIHLEQEGYSEEHFQSDIKKRLLWGLFLSLMIFPVMLDTSITDQVNNYDDKDLKNLEANQADRSNPFGNMRDKMKEIFNIDNMMKKQLLCHRLSKLVLQVKSALDH